MTFEEAVTELEMTLESWCGTRIRSLQEPGVIARTVRACSDSTATDRIPVCLTETGFEGMVAMVPYNVVGTNGDDHPHFG